MDFQLLVENQLVLDLMTLASADSDLVYGFDTFNPVTNNITIDIDQMQMWRGIKVVEKVTANKGPMLGQTCHILLIASPR